MDGVNPFADVGGPVSDDRFVGRETELRTVDSRLFGKGGFGSLAVVGMPRIGKTSLVGEAVRRARPRFKDIRAVSVWIDVGTCSSIDGLFRTVITDFLQEARSAGLASLDMESVAAQSLQHPLGSFPPIRDFFKAVRRAGVRAICILDEFDAGRRLFAKHPECFHWLRGLASSEQFKAGMALISKRRLADIARIAGLDSDYWANVILEVSLQPLSPVETEWFLQRQKDAGVVPDQATLAELHALCGRHPFLLDTYGFYAWDALHHGESLSVDWLRSVPRETLTHYYEQVTTVLRDTGMLEKFVQAVLGPRWDIKPNDVHEMIVYGILRTEGDRGVASFSEGFTQYVRHVEVPANIWMLWRDTERALREAIDGRLRARFGPEWPTQVRRARPRLSRILDNCEALMAKDRARFGDVVASSFLAYTYPQELFQFMAADWPSLGEPLFGPDKQAWASKFSLLAKVRTPLAHNREEVVKEGERAQAEGICREILERMRSLEEGVIGNPAPGGAAEGRGGVEHSH